MTTQGYTGKTELVLDPALPPKTWEKRRGTNSALERTHRELTREEFVLALEDPKCERIAVGQDVHDRLRSVLGTPRIKTSAQEEAEKTAALKRGRKRVKEKDVHPALRRLNPREGLLPWDMPDGPDEGPPGTPGPGGVAS